MRIVRIRPMVAVALSLVLAEAIARDEVYCNETRALTKREGEYARKDIWDNLPRATDWKALGPLLSTGAVLSVTVGANGSYSSATNGWHEGIGTCLKLQSDGKGQLWAAAVNGDPSGDQQIAEAVRTAKWEGPFVRIGPAHASRRLYFQRLFGTACFQTNRGASWCFGPGYIEHGSATYSAELVLDRVEMPGYGFPVVATDTATKEQRLWIFVRSGDAWQVHDERLDLGERMADKSARKPWRTLTRWPE
jgi:hypothetical protein